MDGLGVRSTFGADPLEEVVHRGARTRLDVGIGGRTVAVDHLELRRRHGVVLRVALGARGIGGFGILRVEAVVAGIDVVDRVPSRRQRARTEPRLELGDDLVDVVVHRRRGRIRGPLDLVVAGREVLDHLDDPIRGSAEGLDDAVATGSCGLHLTAGRPAALRQVLQHLLAELAGLVDHRPTLGPGPLDLGVGRDACLVT